MAKKYKPVFKTYTTDNEFDAAFPQGKSTVDKSFQTWDDSSALEYLRVPTTSTVNKDNLKVQTTDMPGYLGWASESGNVFINPQYQVLNNPTDLQNTLTHEIGHTHGLRHTSNKDDMMYPKHQTSTNLSQSEKDQMVDMYGPEITNQQMLQESDVGSVASFYRAIFNRDPDNAGFVYNYNALDGGKVDLKGLADAFVNSTEFAGNQKTNEQFASTFYNNIFNRQAAPEEVNYWKEQLDSGIMDRSDVLMHFAASQENQDKLMSLYGDKMWYDQGE